MEPNPAFDPDSYPEVLEAFDALEDDGRVLVWGADWCKDTRHELPDFAAVLEASALGTDHVEVHEVDREKQGPKVDEYGVELIPTIVVEVDGEEVARFVEDADVPIAVHLAQQLDDAA